MQILTNCCQHPMRIIEIETRCARSYMQLRGSCPPGERPVTTTASLVAFALVALGMALTPGPNMIYLVSRSLSQGRAAGLISLGGVALGFIFYMLCAALGITALLLAV